MYGETIRVIGKDYPTDSMTNIPPAINARLEQKLLCQPNSPLALLWQRIQNHFQRHFVGNEEFEFLRHEEPIVSVEQNFDELLIPLRHPSRSTNDTYYINRRTVLRTHMTAHEREIMASGHHRFLLIGDVYRRDQIDNSHMPVFHQMEGVRIFTPDELLAKEQQYAPLSKDIERALEGQQPFDHDPRLARLAIADLYVTLNGLMQSLFGQQVPIRWQETFFPFTHPSLEAEVNYGGKWLEVFGSGILRPEILHPRVIETHPDAIGWAFGMGLERVAMVLHGIPDIRLFWTKDRRFSDQFVAQEITGIPIKFQSFSKYPPITRDISFFLPNNHDELSLNEFCEVVREIAHDLAENVELVPFEARVPLPLFTCRLTSMRILGVGGKVFATE